jgi:hypothetical protein
MRTGPALCCLVATLCMAPLAAGEAPVKPPPPTNRTQPPGKSPPPAKAPPATQPTTPPKTATQPSADPPPAPILPDIVLLTNGQRIAGTVYAMQPDPDRLAIGTGTGIIQVRRDLVARIEYGLTARIGRVKADDLAGLVELALWCRTRNHHREAMELLAKAIALPGCDLPTRALYATLVDELEGPERALPLYAAYRAAAGDDPAILGRLAELEKARADWETEMRSIGADPATFEASGELAMTATASAVEAGYEVKDWRSENPKFANPAVCSHDTILTPQGPRRVLRVEFSPSPTEQRLDKAAIGLRTQLSLTERTKLILQAQNLTERDLRLAVAVKTGDQWTYHESLSQPLPRPGSANEFTTVTFDLAAATFKTQASSWANNARVAKLDQVCEVQILILNGRTSGAIRLAGIYFDRPDDGKR